MCPLTDGMRRSIIRATKDTSDFSGKENADMTKLNYSAMMMMQMCMRERMCMLCAVPTKCSLSLWAE